MRPVVRAFVIACVAGMVLVGAQAAAAASLYDPNANCISGAPAGWVTAPVATSKGAKLLHGLASLLQTSA